MSNYELGGYGEISGHRSVGGRAMSAVLRHLGFESEASRQRRLREEERERADIEMGTRMFVEAIRSRREMREQEAFDQALTTPE